MSRPVNILINSESANGLAEIMSGYLRFYSENRINVSLSGKKRVIHPLADQVLSEDGIEYEHVTLSKSVFNADLTIFINSLKNTGNSELSGIKHYNFRNPLQSSDYDDILIDFRAVREEIKKECIQLVGELHLV